MYHGLMPHAAWWSGEGEPARRKGHERVGSWLHKDRENRRIPFDPEGRVAPILKRRKSLGPSSFVFGSPAGKYVESFKTAWESLLLVANGYDTKRAKHGARVDREKLRQIDLHWHDLRHEGAWAPERWSGHPHDPADARPRRHQTDAAVPEHHGRRTSESDDGSMGTTPSAPAVRQ